MVASRCTSSLACSNRRTVRVLATLSTMASALALRICAAKIAGGTGIPNATAHRIQATSRARITTVAQNQSCSRAPTPTITSSMPTAG